MENDQTPELYNKEEVEKDSTAFLSKLLALTQLTPNHKLGVSNEQLFIEGLENGNLQAWWRKARGQSRVVVNTFLKKELYDYYLFLLFVKQLLDLASEDPVLQRIRQTHAGFLSNLSQGLSVLSDTYPEYQELRSMCFLYRTRFSDCQRLLDPKQD